MSEGNSNAKLKVFIAYSRSDLEFSDQLAAGLELTGFEVLIDRQSISGAEDWKTRLVSLIAEADSIVFVLSPHAAASQIFAWEVSEAQRQAKRIIPVVARPLEGAGVPPELAALNYIFLYPDPKVPGSGLIAGLKLLATVLNTNLDWLRDHTRLGELARRWEARGKTNSLLLRGDELELARAWISRRPRDAPEISALHLEFIQASQMEVESTQQAPDLQKMIAAAAFRESQLNELLKRQEERIAALERTDKTKRRKRGGVFISYRRDDSKANAGRIYDWLARDFDRRSVFIDVDTIQKGSNFTEVLNEHLDQCDVMLVLIGPIWLIAENDRGGRRLNDPEDFVRREIKAALSREVAVIPVLLDGAPMPRATDLPKDLEGLALRQNYSVSYENFGRDVEGLKKHIRAQSPSKAKTPLWYFGALSAAIFVVLVVFATSSTLRDWFRFFMEK